MSPAIKEVYPAREPFGLHFRQILPTQPQMGQTTSEPEVTSPDGSDPDKIDSRWIPDEDEDEDEDDASPTTASVNTEESNEILNWHLFSSV